jgi:hypothetical protein
MHGRHRDDAGLQKKKRYIPKNDLYEVTKTIPSGVCAVQKTKCLVVCKAIDDVLWTDFPKSPCSINASSIYHSRPKKSGNDAVGYVEEKGLRSLLFRGNYSNNGTS